MSSPLRKSVFRSSIFRVNLLVSVVVMLATLAVLWVIVLLVYWQYEGEVRDVIAEELALIEQTYREDGLDALVESLDYGEGAHWDVDQAHEVLLDDDFLIALFTEDELLAGFGDLEPEVGWSTLHVDLDDAGEKAVVARRVALDDEVSVAVAFHTEGEMTDMVDAAAIVTVVLPVLWLVCAVVVGVGLSRLTQRRLVEVAEVAAKVGQPSLDPRVSLTGREDEFDDFAALFNEMLDRFQVLAKNLEGVSIGVAHDLRTPIANLGGRLQLIERDIQDPEAVSGHVIAAQDHIATLLRTLEALLRLGDVEAGKRRAGFQRVSLSLLVSELCETFEPVFADADKSLEATIAPDVFVRGDGDLLSQMLTNLLENILEHARDGARGSVRLLSDGSRACLLVADDGPGIPATRAEQVFERFFRLDASRNTPGNGLGLSLVKAIAELHGGDAQLTAHAPGAQIEVTLPLGN